MRLGRITVTLASILVGGAIVFSVCGTDRNVDRVADLVTAFEGAEEEPREVEEVIPENDTPYVVAFRSKLIDPDNHEYRIKAMGLGNNVWAFPKRPTYTHHDEETYHELAELGFNTVRFYMNYQIFEDDKAPYEYKEEAFDWIDTNIEWAKKYGIKLILNMHIAQGGPQASSKAALWRSEELMNRFEKLWLEIAERYAEEPAVLGLSPLNEPYLPDTFEAGEALDYYWNYLDRLIARIREKDPNHLIFVERPYGLVSESGKYTYPWGSTDSFEITADSNVVYEFHYYVTDFTGQESSYSKHEKKWCYGDDTRALVGGASKLLAIQKETPDQRFDPGSTKWQYVESPFYSGKGSNANFAYWIMYIRNAGAGSKLFFDDIVIKEYDADGNYLRDVYKYSFNYTTACAGWDMGSGTGGSVSYETEYGAQAPGCEAVSDVAGEYRFMKNNMNAERIVFREDCKYKVAAYVNGENVSSETEVLPALQLGRAYTIHTFNADYLAYQLDPFRKFSKKNKVPIFVGEIGSVSRTIGNEYRGEDYLSDLFDYLNKYGIGYSYHDYHEQNWGYYTIEATKERDNQNAALKEVFLQKVGQ